MEDKTLALMNMSESELDNALQSMSAQQFVTEAKAIISFFNGVHKGWTEPDKKIIATAQKVLTDGNLESFEERKYFMETMKEAAKRSDIKSAIIGVGAFLGIGTLAAIIIKSITKK